MLHATLLQLGEHYVEVHGRHTDVHINVDGHLLGALGVPEVDLQMAAKFNM